MVDFARKPTKKPTSCSKLIHLMNLFSASYQHKSMSSAESPPYKNLDQLWSGFFYWKCRSKTGQLCLSGVLQLKGSGWLNVVMSIGRGIQPKICLPNCLPKFACLPNLTICLSSLPTTSFVICWQSIT